MIVDDYTINQQTLAITPARAMEYESIVTEQSQTLLVKKSALKLIKEACEANWRTYEGSRKVAINRTSIFRKVPIIMNIGKRIVAFPTHSPNNFDCSWIFIHYLAKISKCTKNKGLSIITYKNGIQLPLDISIHILEKQYQRALAVYYQALLNN